MPPTIISEVPKKKSMKKKKKVLRKKKKDVSGEELEFEESEENYED